MTIQVSGMGETIPERVTLHLDPRGQWRHQRFEFCNALEAATDEQVAAQLRAAAWAELQRLGAIKAEEGRE